VALSASSISGLYLLAVLGFGAWWVTADWDELTCCKEPAQADTAGLAAVQASSWMLGSAAVVATLGAIVLALRMRRAVCVLPVLALCVTSVVIGQVLWSRV
jgi:hypothetical protein